MRGSEKGEAWADCCGSARDDVRGTATEVVCVRARARTMGE